MVVCIVVCMIVGYLFGCIQTGYIVGRVNKIDIRDYGSGNSGTTNTLRTLGKTAAIITFLGDAAKGLVAVNLARYVIMPAFGVEGEAYLWLLTGFAVVLGHNFPFYLGFIITIISKYVSLGSICMVLIIPFILYFNNPQDWKLVVVGCIFTAMAIWRHRANIVRLMNGTENKLGQKVKR